MAPPPESDSIRPSAENGLRRVLHRALGWWSNHSFAVQVAAAMTVSVACGSLAWVALSPSFTSVGEMKLSWRYGAYSVARHCTDRGLVAMKIDNTTPANVTVQIESPGYAPGLGWHPLYLSEKSADSRRSIAVAAHGRVEVYAKLDETSQECADDATGLLKVVSVKPGNSGGTSNH
ncbi:hypothetical protein ACH41H_48635 [Streptomyces sp. NPDC020800]|uniref:hypothetical protein n=1 Tax=Streptomyces sp. NPDC020800 TaxID=3365092 RepID=UPI003790AFDE